MMRARSLGALALALVTGACGGKTSEDTTDACTACGDAGGKDTMPPPVDIGPITDLGPPPPFDGGPPPPIDAGPPPPTDCLGPVKDPENPPIGCGPDPGVPKCSSIVPVASCPTDNPCMARAKPTAPNLDFRIGRLRFYLPDALLSLTALAIDPNVNPKCDNNGNDALNWMMRFDTSKNTLLTGGAPKSTDGGTTYALSHGTVDASALGAICPGFVGPATPIALDPVTVAFKTGSDGYTSASIAKLNLPIFEGSVPFILPLSDLQVRHAKSSDGVCIGAWSRDFWCDGDSLGWTTGGAIVAKILAEDADRVPVRTAGCQSLCAIQANDSSKVTGKLCKRGADGKIPPIGDTTLSAPNDAFLLSATFAAYGVKIIP